jgi:hypothetical protein
MAHQRIQHELHGVRLVPRTVVRAQGLYRSEHSLCSEIQSEYKKHHTIDVSPILILFAESQSIARADMDRQQNHDGLFNV